MDPGLKKLKKARAEIEAVLKRHDIAGFVTLHSPGWGEAFWSIWPSHSILIGDFPAIRVKSDLADFGGDLSRQRDQEDQTAQMIRTLAMSMSNCSVQFLELADILDGMLGTQTEPLAITPSPSKMNPGVH